MAKGIYTNAHLLVSIIEFTNSYAEKPISWILS